MIRLNIGCGKRILPGYVNVDAVDRPGVDRVAPADGLPFADQSADEVLAVHLVEHVFEWEVPGMLREWARVLRPGGRLVVEMPDAKKCARNLLEGKVADPRKPDQLGMWGLYGDATLRDPFMMHKSGWWFARLKPVVAQAGFHSVTERVTEFHPVGRVVRDFRLEAVRSEA